MNSDFTPVNIGLLSDGAFLDEVQEQFDEAKRALLNHIAANKEKIIRAKATVNVTISLDYDVKGGISITTECKHKVPALPARSSRVIPMADEATGEIDLFVQKSGAFNGPPQQQRICKEDGTGIDPVSREPSETHTIKVGPLSKNG
jgi:hypothetical protein